MEILTVLTIVGIMFGIAIPSFMAMQGNAKVNNSLGLVRDALEIAQFRASQKKRDELGNTCRVYIPTNQNKIIGNCLVSSSSSSVGVDDNTDSSLRIASGLAVGTVPRSLNGWATVNLDEGITIKDNSTLPGLPPLVAGDPRRVGDPPRVVYNLQGLTQYSGIIVLGSSATSTQKCLILEAGIGLIRSGNYINNNCEVAE